MGLAKTELQRYVAEHGSEIRVGGRTFVVLEVSTAGASPSATIICGRAYYLGQLCANAKDAPHPGAEVWSVVSGPREIARLAFDAGKMIQLRPR